jgi:Flp pilus assembly protein TadG
MSKQLPRGSTWRELRRDRSAGAALEFAVVALPFITFLVFLLEIGYDFFAQVSLDYGVQTAARQIQIGNAQGANTAAVFQTDYLCPALSGLLPCSSVTVNVTPITSDYYSSVSATLPVNSSGTFSTSGFTYCPGSPNQLMLVQAYYLSPSLLAAVVPSMAASTAGGLQRVTVSSMAFINENFPVTSPAPAGC